MANIVKLSEVSKKYYKKVYMNSRKIKFGEQLDKNTGEITLKEFQATIYVPDGNETPYCPQVCLNLKLGNQAISFFADDVEHLYNAIENLYKYVFDIKQQKTLHDTLIKARSNYFDLRRKEIATEEQNSVKTQNAKKNLV